MKKTSFQVFMVVIKGTSIRFFYFFIAVLISCKQIRMHSSLVLSQKHWSDDEYKLTRKWPLYKVYWRNDSRQRTKHGGRKTNGQNISGTKVSLYHFWLKAWENCDLSRASPCGELREFRALRRIVLCNGSN